MAEEVVALDAPRCQAALEAILELRRQMADLWGRVDALVVDARAAGATWDDVAFATGLGKSQAHRRWAALCGMFGAGKTYLPRRTA